MNASCNSQSPDIRDVNLPSISKSSASSNGNVNEQSLYFNFDEISLPSTYKLTPIEEKQDYLTHCDKPLSSEKIKIIDIHIIPKCTKRSQKTTRKCQKSEILTSTPIKEEIRSAKASKAKKEVVKRKIVDICTIPALKMPKPPVEKINPDENSVACILCGDTFGNSKPGEEWIECNICSQWAHKLCADYSSGVFICDICRQSVLSSRK